VNTLQRSVERFAEEMDTLLEITLRSNLVEKLSMALYDCLFEEDQEDSSSASESKVLLAHLLCACVCTRGGRLLCSSASALAQFVPHRTCWSHFVWWFGKRITSTEGLSEHALRRRMYVSNLVVVVGWVGNTELGIYGGVRSICASAVTPTSAICLSIPNRVIIPHILTEAGPQRGRHPE
jgi:hypothetical protein